MYMILKFINTKSYSWNQYYALKHLHVPFLMEYLKGTEFTEVYKKQYCEAGEEGRKRCRRFQVASVTGKCPPNVLPNATKTAEQIIAEMKKAGIS